MTSKKSYYRGPFRKEYDLDFFGYDNDNEVLRITMLSSLGENEPESVYFRWDGHLRMADCSALRKILSEPEFVFYPVEKNLLWYDDLKSDGNIDTKVQTLSSRHSLIMEDSNGDLFFDRAFIWDSHSDHRSHESKVKILVPKQKNGEQ